MSKDNSRNDDGTRAPEFLTRPIIASWQISNFQSIRESVKLPLAPLTIFSGPNSSGKSAVIRSILMVAQSLGSSAWKVPLVLNGKYTHLGDFDDILHHGCEPPEIELGFAIKSSADEQITVRTTIENHSTQRKIGNNQYHMRVRRCIVQWGDSNEDRFELNYQPVELKADEIQRASQIVREQIDKGLFDYKIIHPKSIESRPQFETAISSSLTNFLPGRVLTRVQSKIRDLTLEIEQLTNAILTSVDERISTASIDWEWKLSEEAKAAFGVVRRRLPPPRNLRSGEDDYMRALREISEWTSQLTIKRLKEFLEKRLHSGQIRDLSRRLSGTLPEMQRLIDSNPLSHKRTELEVGQFPTQYNQVIQWIRQVFGNRIFYLGPLRDDPKVIYAMPPLPNQKDVGLKGEYTAAMLNMYQNLNVDYPLPPESEEHFDGRYLLKQGKLSKAVQIWLRRMGLAESFGTSVTSKVGYQLTVRPEGLEQGLDLTSLGVGVSQVLPTIVMGLLAPVDSVLIFEQPEVHLHPKVQSILGDFFLGIVACGKQCIVETHSEYLINRIRRRIAESEDTRLLQQLRIYFAELENAVSQFRAVEANEYGAIMEWPRGFFDEAEEESSAIIRASMEKRRAARQQRLQQE